MVPDPFGRAIRDHHLGEQDEALLQRDGEEVQEHPIERFYFGEYTGEGEVGEWFEKWLDGPLLDIGAGVGRHSLYFQEKYETVAIEVSENLVKTMRERGVRDARHADMFSLRYNFERDRFASALSHGTQLGLVRSMEGLRRFLGDLAYVTDPEATAVVDCYDPESEGTADLLGYRTDPTRGLAYRVMHFEYEGEVGETLIFRLFSPDRLREATVGTGWEVSEIQRGPDDNSYHYHAALSKV
ncbi:MAG: class I SAM-dependent methyltransferase [Halobacteria archaeon]|nr:class I SAM-dependent methyltransferase [Halobacteria archaeon]